MVERSLSQMGTADRGSLRQVELQPAGAQRVGHADGAGTAIGTELGQRLEQARGVVVDEVAEDVEVLAAVVERGELDGRDHAEAASPPACSASSTPSTVSWSVSASSSTPASAAAATTARGGSAPSEHVECDCRSNAGAPIARP